MSEAPDPLESEMAALRPCEPSPALRQHIAERIADSTLGKRRRLWWVALAGGLAAACVGALILLRTGTSGRVDPERIVIQHQAAPSPEVEDSRPTLQAYRLALARSPEDLDALLDKHAVVAPELNSPLTRIRACTRSETELQALIGEN